MIKNAYLQDNQGNIIRPETTSNQVLKNGAPITYKLIEDMVYSYSSNTHNLTATLPISGKVVALFKPTVSGTSRVFKVNGVTYTLMGINGASLQTYNVIFTENSLVMVVLDIESKTIYLLGAQADGTTMPNLNLTNTTESTSLTTGAIISAGGAGIAGNVYAKGLRVTEATASTSVTTGAAVITGGMGVSGNLYAKDVKATATTASTSVSTGALVVSGGAGVAGNLYAKDIKATNTTASTSTTTGALTVAGGVGVAGTLYANEEKVVASTASTSVATGAMVVAGGVGIGGALYAQDIYVRIN